jgi:parallel beta-helix repeat protein
MVIALFVSILALSPSIVPIAVDSAAPLGTPHAPIRINSDADFPGTASGGNGTVWAPWMIENLEIDANGSGPCIFVGNTTEHYEVNNCTLFNASGQTIFPYFLGGGVVVSNSINASINNNTFTNNSYGIVISGSPMINITQNNASDNFDNGILLSDSINCHIENNSICNNNIGFNASMILSPNALLHNNFINNTIHLLDNDAMNWDGGYPAGGNFYDNHTGPDVNMDGICDDPHIFDVDSRDRYPLMQPYIGQVFVEKLAPHSTDWEPMGSNVIVTTIIAIEWNETMNWTSVEEAFNYTNNVTVWNSTNGTWVHNSTTNTSVFTPTVLFEYLTEYWVSVNVTATDLVGNFLDQDKNGTGGYWPEDVLTWNFTTAEKDLTLPYALNYTPLGSVVPINSSIVIEWNETMNWTSVEEVFSFSDGYAIFNSTHGTWTHNSSANVSTFVPFTYFDYEVEYNVTVNCSASDVAGNPLDQNQNGTFEGWPEDALYWTFTTVDPPPVVVSTVPENGITGVNPEKPIIITFSEEMTEASVEMAFIFSNGTVNWYVADGTATWNANRTIFTFTPFNNLLNNTTYNVIINGDMARGADLKFLDGDYDGFQGGNYSWWFTTWLEPPFPHVINTFPPHGSTNIAVNTRINIVFDVEMDVTSVASAFTYSDGSNVWGAYVGTVVWFYNNSYFSFQPDQSLDYDTTYTVFLNASARSTYGQPLDGNNNGAADSGDDFNFTFRTAIRPPYVVSTYPNNYQMNVAINISNIFINFSKEMNQASVASALSISPNVNYTLVWSGFGKNLEVRLNEVLTASTEYWVTVSISAMDLQNTLLDGDNNGVAGGSNFLFYFTTAGTTTLELPRVVDYRPLNNETVSINMGVLILFNNRMNRSSVEAGFSLTNSTGALVNGSFQWNATSMVVGYVPSENLTYNTTYHVLLTTEAKNINGIAIDEGVSWQFRTEVDSSSSLFENDWWLYSIVIVLLLLVCFLFFKNRGVQMQLRKLRVENKKLKRKIKDDAAKDDRPNENDVAGDDRIDETPEPATEEPPPPENEIIEN